MCLSFPQYCEPLEGSHSSSYSPIAPVETCGEEILDVHFPEFLTGGFVGDYTVTAQHRLT